MIQQEPLPNLGRAGVTPPASKARMRLAHRVLERLVADPDVEAEWCKPVDYPEFRAPEAVRFDDMYVAQAYQPGLGDGGSLLIVTEIHTGVVDVWLVHQQGRSTAVDGIERVWDTGRSDPYIRDEVLDGLVHETQVDHVWRAITGKAPDNDL